MRLVQWQQTLDEFQLEKDRSTDNDVCDIAAIQPCGVIEDWQAHLPLERRLGAPKLMTQARLIDRFEETRTEAPMQRIANPMI
jgi:hypothetical protein